MEVPGCFFRSAQDGSHVHGLVDAGVGHVDPDPLPEGARDRVGGVDPAVDVHDVAAHAVRHAVDRISDELSGGYLQIIELFTQKTFSIVSNPDVTRKTLPMQDPLLDSVTIN